MSENVLLVHHGSERDRIAGWLEDAGYNVIVCPGPLGPDYTCIGARTGTCPLMTDSDVVILDMNLDSDQVMAGTPSWQLVDFYIAQGRKVLTLGTAESLSAVYPPGSHETWQGPLERDRMITTVGRMSGLIQAEVETA